MDATVGSADLFPHPDVWLNDSFMFNTTAANTSGVVFKSMLSPVMDQILNISLITIVFITMISMGCTMEVSKIKVTSAFCSYRCYHAVFTVRLDMITCRFSASVFEESHNEAEGGDDRRDGPVLCHASYSFLLS